MSPRPPRALAGALLLGVLVTACADTGDTVDAARADAPSPTAAVPATEPGESPAAYRGYPVRVEAGREVRVPFDDHGVGEVRFRAPADVVVDVFTAGADRGIVIRDADGTDLGHLFPVGGLAAVQGPHEVATEVAPPGDLDQLAAVLVEPDRFPGVTVEPVAATAVGDVTSLVLDLVGDGEPPPDGAAVRVLRVAPRTGGAELETQVWIGPVPGTRERLWLLDVDGERWAYATSGGRVDLGNDLVLSLRFSA